MSKSRSTSRVREKSVFESYGVHEHIQRQMRAKVEQKVIEKLKERGSTSNVKSRKKLQRVTVPIEQKINPRFAFNDLMQMQTVSRSKNHKSCRQLLNSGKSEDELYQAAQEYNYEPIEEIYRDDQAFVPDTDAEFHEAVYQLHEYLHTD